MELRLPGDQTVADVRPDDVVVALGHLVAGDYEFVALEGEIAWLQTADVPGGYVLERSFGGPEPEAQPSPLSADQVQAAFLAFLAGDVNCGLPWPEPAPVEPKKKRGFFRR
jgi:hypothetical protein